MLYYILFSTNLTAKEAVIHFLITIGVFMISLAVHEFSHALAAFKSGDPTPKLMGRMSLNPFKHLDTSGFLFFILLGVGWAKPVPINALNFKKYKKGIRWVTISGILANFLLGLVCAITMAILLATVGASGGVAMQYVYSILLYFMLVNSFLAMFNLLPIPNFDGFNFFITFTKGENKFFTFMQKNGIKILLGLILVGILTDLFFGFDILTIYMSTLYDFVYLPITWLGVL